VSAPLRVMAVVGTTRSLSKTKALAELIISRLAAHADISAEVIEIHALTPGLGAAVEREQLDERTEAAIRATESADLLIAATPVFRRSYSGLFKHFFDFDGQYALAGKPVLLVATSRTRQRPPTDQCDPAGRTAGRPSQGRQFFWWLLLRR
jgi:FMN reductase